MWTSIAEVRARGNLPPGVLDSFIQQAIDEAYAFMVAREDVMLLPDALKPVAERYLTLHLLDAGKPQISGESMAGASVSFAVPSGSGLESSAWGQLYLAMVKPRGGIPLVT
jgi:hypothetical protein